MYVCTRVVHTMRHTAVRERVKNDAGRRGAQSIPSIYT